MFICQPTTENVLEISRIYAASWKSAYRGMVPQGYLDQLREDAWVPVSGQWLSGTEVKALSVWEGKEMLGCSFFGESREASLPAAGEIISLYLKPEAFGKGYGGALFRAVVDSLRDEGYRQACLLYTSRRLLHRRWKYSGSGRQNIRKIFMMKKPGKGISDIFTCVWRWLRGR